MSAIYYIEFKAADTVAPIGYCISDLASQLHGYMRKSSINLGISFPEMTEEFIGSRIRIFGSSEQLSEVLSNKEIQNGCQRGVYHPVVYIPKAVPDNAKAISYLKDSSAYANSDIANKAFKKALRRYNSRHEAPMPKGEEKLFRLSYLNKVKSCAYVMIKATDENEHRKMFRVPIIKSDAPKHVSSGGTLFNSYGLGNPGGNVFDF